MRSMGIGPLRGVGTVNGHPILSFCQTLVHLEGLARKTRGLQKVVHYPIHFTKKSALI